MRYLPRKTQRCYTVLFDFLKTKLEEMNRTRANIQWRIFMNDFESGLIPALEAAFPDDVQHPEKNILRQGCYYHFCSAVIKALQRYHLKADYDDPESPLRNFIKLLLASAFAPPEEMEQVTATILGDYMPEQYRNNPNMLEFLQYFNTQWFNNPNLPVAMWSVWQLDDHRTNNNLEGWHRYLNSELGAHENLWRFMLGLRKVQNNVENDEIQMQNNRHPAKRQKSDREKEDALRTLKASYIAGNIGTMNYLLNFEVQQHLSDER